MQYKLCKISKYNRSFSRRNIEYQKIGQQAICSQVFYCSSSDSTVGASVGSLGRRRCREKMANGAHSILAIPWATEEGEDS